LRPAAAEAANPARRVAALKSEKKMKISGMLFKEIFLKKNRLFSGLLAVTLGVAVIVAIKNISFYSEKKISSELDTLGANILILPKSATVQDYYQADLQEDEIPEEYVTKLTGSGIKGLDNISPKLNVRTEVQGQPVVVTGILPLNEFKSKSVWAGALGIFTKPEGCPPGGMMPIGAVASNPDRVINDLGRFQALVGYEAAEKMKIKKAGEFKIKGAVFTVMRVLPQTGTIDDARVFIHLKTMQPLFDKKKVLSAIEISGCCSAISDGLINKINKALPDAKVVTISQIVSTQINTNKIMNNISMILIVIVLLMGAAGIANFMFDDVYERRREIGILTSMGADDRWIMKLFLAKAVLLGLAGGVAGFILGSVIALVLGPGIAGIQARPMPMLGFTVIIISIVTSVAASIVPVINAVKMEPFAAIRED
jgi:putative ABC transport system permease protein